MECPMCGAPIGLKEEELEIGYPECGALLEVKRKEKIRGYI